MSAAFTPGPWKVGRVTCSYAPIKCGDGQIARTAAPTNTILRDETIANAHLIAASPELYAALELCVLKLRRCATNAGNADFAVDALCEQFEATLAKARGELVPA